MLRRKLLALGVLVTLARAGLAAPDPGAQASGPAGLDARFRGALQAAWSGDTETAWRQLSELWEQFGVRRPALAYDLGALALARGAPAEAVYYLRVAERLAPPADLAEDIALGLARARSQLTRDAERDVHRQHLVHGSVTGLAYGALHRASEATLAWTAVALAAAFATLFAWRRGRAGAGARTALVTLALATAVAVGAWTGRVIQDRSLVLGVVRVDDAALREALDPAAPVHPVPGGVEVQVLEDPDGDHLRVRLPTGRKGWLPRTSVGLL